MCTHVSTAITFTLAQGEGPLAWRIAAKNALIYGNQTGTVATSNECTVELAAPQG